MFEAYLAGTAWSDVAVALVLAALVVVLFNWRQPVGNKHSAKSIASPPKSGGTIPASDENQAEQDTAALNSVLSQLAEGSGEAAEQAFNGWDERLKAESVTQKREELQKREEIDEVKALGGDTSDSSSDDDY